MQPFESHRPATLDEVLAVLGHSSASKVLAGARDLFPELPIESSRGCFASHGARAAMRDHRARLARVQPETAADADDDDGRRAPAR